ncbi:unnamed protein product [Parnassius apollo]|uniref:(apollo) hypothetical protein n=1 Tax=Parnassius apollo TaxID=110799 RepID=A0A8S3XQY3_PARAO|nr:unnamed protein product [Parnassius apollo]
MANCSHCGKVFKYESERIRHELSHLPRFGCEECEKKFTYISALRRHQKQHERTESIQCDKCSHSFKDEILLKRHIKYAHEGTYICSECGAKFNSKQALSIHIITHKPKSERKYRCSYANCHKAFNFSHHLKYHEMTHTNTRKHFCKICGKGFIQSHNLKVHIMNIHDPTKWLPCEITNCKKKFSSEYARKRHHARHKNFGNEEKKPPDRVSTSVVSSDGFTCSICGQLFLPSFYEEHKLNCIVKDFELSNDKPFDLSSKLKKEEFETSNKSDLLSASKITDEYLSTCTAVLGKCLVTGDTSVSSNCLCAQMVKPDDNYDKTIEKTNTNTDIKEIDNATKTCESCSCSTAKTEEKFTSRVNVVVGQKIKKSNRNNCMPDFEYATDGTVKVRNTIDPQFECMANKYYNNITKRKVDFRDRTNESTIPYNSCKAVLGKCIVSENGMINDDCLCAKMLIDEGQMTSQEIEEITPHPNCFSL